MNLLDQMAVMVALQMQQSQQRWSGEPNEGPRVDLVPSEANVRGEQRARVHQRVNAQRWRRLAEHSRPRKTGRGRVNSPNGGPLRGFSIHDLLAVERL